MLNKLYGEREHLAGDLAEWTADLCTIYLSTSIFLINRSRTYSTKVSP